MATLAAYVYEVMFNVGTALGYCYVVWRGLYKPALFWHAMAPPQWRLMIGIGICFALFGIVARALELAHTLSPAFDILWWRQSYVRTDLIPILSSFAWFLTYKELTTIFGTEPRVGQDSLPVVRIDAAGGIRAWNEAAEALFGWGIEEVRGQELASVLVPERLRDAHRAGLERLRDGVASAILDRPFQTMALRRTVLEDGTVLFQEIPVEVVITPSGQGQNRGYIGLIRPL